MSIPTAVALPVRLRRLVRQVHRWVGLLIAIQVLFWVSGGVVMSVLRLEEVRGEHLAAKRERPVLDAARPVVPVDKLLRRFADRRPTSITLTSLLERPVYRLEGGGQAWLVDAAHGTDLSPLPREMAERIAQADYTGDAPMTRLELFDTPLTEIRGRDLPLWRADFADALDTTIYVSPDTGAVVARRNDLWRVFDFMWMLHIMDYEEREDFNHPLLVITAITALLFVCSGLVMLYYSFKPRPRGTTG